MVRDLESRSKVKGQGHFMVFYWNTLCGRTVAKLIGQSSWIFHCLSRTHPVWKWTTLNIQCYFDFIVWHIVWHQTAKLLKKTVFGRIQLHSIWGTPITHRRKTTILVQNMHIYIANIHAKNQRDSPLGSWNILPQWSL